MSKHKHKIKHKSTVTNTSKVHSIKTVPSNHINSFFDVIIKKFTEFIAKITGNEIQNEIDNSKRFIAMANYLKTYYKECLDNAQNKLDLVGKLSHKPSDDSLNELELLKDYSQKLYEDAASRYIYEKKFTEFVQDIKNK